MTMFLTIHEDQPKIPIESAEQLDAALSEATPEARIHGMLNIVFIEAENGDCIGLAVGGDETVLCFDYGHRLPPYYVSRGSSHDEDPVLTAYTSFQHHTEFRRRNVIPAGAGRLAALEFFRTGALPECIEWEEV
jgi:Immunity protein Imm1